VTASLARAICVFAETLVAQKRVMVVGDSSLGLHELLVELGARVVHVFDPDAARAMRQVPPESRGVVLRGMPEGDFDVRDGAFDFAIVPDLGGARDPAALLARLRRVVGADGALLCAAQNRDADVPDARAGGLDYYELYDLISLQFANVRMIAAMPFVGVTLAELGQDEVDGAVRVDAQLVAADRPPPNAFVVLASQSDMAPDARPEAYAVIETGEAPRARDAVTLTDATDAAELAQARLRAEALAAQVEELVHAKKARAAADEETRRALEALDTERERAAHLERLLDQEKRKPAPPAVIDRTHEIAEQLAQAQIRSAALEEGVELAEKTIVVQRERIAELEAELDAERARAHEAIAASTARTREPAEDHEEIARLEEKLRERGERVAALEAEVARREKLVRELVTRLDEAPVESGDPALGQKLDELAILAAHQRSELEARAWRIAELTEKVREKPTP